MVQLLNAPPGCCLYIRKRLRSLKPYLQLCMFTCRLRQRGWRSISCPGAGELGMGQLCCGHCVRHCWCCGQREESSCGRKSFVCLLINVGLVNIRSTSLNRGCLCLKNRKTREKVQILIITLHVWLPSFLTLPLFLKAHGDNPGKTTRVAVAVVDTFVWQALASVIIPGFTINRVCAASLYLLGRTTKWPLPIRKWTTTAIGLSTIPFIITPIDRLAQDAYWCVFNWVPTQASSVTFNWDQFWKLNTKNCLNLDLKIKTTGSVGWLKETWTPNHQLPSLFLQVGGFPVGLEPSEGLQWGREAGITRDHAGSSDHPPLWNTECEEGFHGARLYSHSQIHLHNVFHCKWYIL